MAGVAEVYLPAFGLALGMSPVLAGLLSTVPLFTGGVLQLIAPRAIVRTRSLRGWVAACMALQALSFVPLIVVALTRTHAPALVFASASLYWGAGMAASAGWTPWMARVVPAKLRNKFFGRRQGLVQATMLVGLVSAGFALHAFAGTDRILDAYAGLFALALAARLVSTISVARQGQGVDPTPRRRMRLRSVPPRLKGTPRASLLGYLVAASAAAAISGPFLTPYLLVQEGLGYLQYSIFTATIMVTKIVALPLAGRLVARVGLRRMLSASALAIAPIPFLWLASDQFWWLIVLQIYAGIAWAGFDLGLLLSLFDAADDAERTTIQVAYSALNAIGNAGASLVGGALLGYYGSDHHAYMMLFVVSAIARFAAAVLVVRNLPKVLVRLPVTVVVGAWTIAIRPWGGTIVRPLVEGLGKLAKRERG
ncbi:MAG: MFS transporter [Kofleriaceae bacterium]|nr:MFS transporter [Kofleriaceae bacterium]